MYLSLVYLLSGNHPNDRWSRSNPTCSFGPVRRAKNGSANVLKFLQNLKIDFTCKTESPGKRKLRQRNPIKAQRRRKRRRRRRRQVHPFMGSKKSNLWEASPSLMPTLQKRKEFCELLILLTL